MNKVKITKFNQLNELLAKFAIEYIEGSSYWEYAAEQFIDDINWENFPERKQNWLEFKFNRNEIEKTLRSELNKPKVIKNIVNAIYDETNDIKAQLTDNLKYYFAQEDREELKEKFLKTLNSDQKKMYKNLNSY